MNVLEYMRLNRRSFGTKIIAWFSLFIIMIYLSFSAFFIYYQSRMMREHILYEGEHLAGLIAHSARLGVFAEDKDLLKGPLEGVLQYDEAVMVQVFNDEGWELSAMKKSEESYGRFADKEAAIRAMEEFDRTGAIFHIEKGDIIEFWAPVTSRERYSEEELFFKDGVSDAREIIIGSVRAVFTTAVLKDNLKDVFMKSTVVPSIFLISGLIIAYFIVRGITGPLKKLTSGVKSLESTGKFEKVSVETGDEVGRLAAAFNDMSDSLVKREKEKEELEEQLRHAQKMEAIGTFSGGIAHDFNNIMTVIKSYGQMLRKKGITEGDEGRYLDRVLSSADKASALTRSLLAFSRKQTINPCAVKLNEMFSHIEYMLKPLVDESIELEIIQPDKDMVIMADRVHMEQVFINLATNARDAMPEGGTIRIGAAAVEPGMRIPLSLKNGQGIKYCVISVSDTGAGMDKQTMERIFDPFFTTKDVGKGTGLGLSMAYGIIDQHGGYLDVRSEAGQGTAFDIYLPLTDAAVDEEECEDLSEVKGGTETILFAEDDEDVRSLMAMVLEKAGYRVIEAADGTEALEMFRNQDAVELLLLDIKMPEKNGLEVYAEIKKTDPDMKVLFVSGYTDKIPEVQGCNESLLVEGEPLLYKPVVPDDLLRKVREIIDS
jgi:signal transduction histidine kinase